MAVTPNKPLAPTAKKLLALVVGGAGFVGGHVVQQLLDAGKYAVRVFDIRPVSGQPPGAVESVVGDIRKLDDVVAATAGVDVVFHVATAAPTGENSLNKALMDAVNVKGTEHVLEACRRAGVRRLVYTSSASVVFDGKQLFNVDESTPYAPRPWDYYTKTKIEGERLVLAANGRGGLATVALRPSGIFGPGDAVFVPTMVRQAKKGKMKYILGSGANEMDFTYVANVAQAHLQAAEALSATSALAGKPYFVTNQEPRPFWGFSGDLLVGLGYGRPRIHLPVWLVLLVACIFEYVLRPMLRPFVEISSDFTVNRIYIVTRNRTFSSDAARRDFGYVPKVPLSVALQKTTEAFAHLAAGAGDGKGAAAAVPAPTRKKAA